MSHPSSLVEMERGLRTLLDKGEFARPFLCSGSPFGCEVAIVGINPRTSTPFWPYWSADRGFDKAAWLAEYKAVPGNARNQTRPRIELLLNELHPIRCLELNIYSSPTPDERSLTLKQKDSRVFEYMLEAVRPRLLFAFGMKPARALAAFLGVEPFTRGVPSQCSFRSETITVLAETHLSRGWSYQRVKELAQTLRSRMDASQ